MQFDFRKKVSTNVELLKANAGKLTAYGVEVNVPLLVLIITANVERAMQQEWGREFRTAVSTFREKHGYNVKHDQTTMDELLTALAAADSLRVMSDAPEPQEHALVATDYDQVMALQQMMMQQQQQINDYEEAAYGVQSESDSSDSAPKRKKKSKKEKERGRGDRRSQSRGRSQSRRRERKENECKHCKGYRKYAAKHDEEKCWYNKKYKGFKPKHVCDDFGLTFKPRDDFPEELGGPRKYDSEESS